MAANLEELALRQATVDDMPFLYRVHRAALRDVVEAIWGWDEAYQVARFQETFAPEAIRVVQLGGVDIGALRVDDQGRELYVDYIALLPDWQGQGVGAALVRQVQDQAAGRGIPVALGVLRGNRARALYERLGFRVVAFDDPRYFMRWQPGGATMSNVTRMQGRVIRAGRTEGVALVSPEPIGFLGGVDPQTGIVVEPNHPLQGQSVAGRVLVFPSGKGSTVGSYTILRLARNGVAPLAMINAESEAIVAVGAIIADIPMVDQIAVTLIRDGDWVSVDGDTVEIGG